MNKKELVMALKDMSDEEILALIRNARKEESQHTGYEKADEYYYIGVDGDIATSTFQNDYGLYDCANYYSDIEVARNCNRADTLMRKLRRFAAEHGGCVAPCGPTAWYITYHYPDEAFEVKCAEYDSENFTPGMVLFATEQAAQDAIAEFSEELYWYFNYYEPMPHDFSYGRDTE